jgi:hypothetical protein
MFKVPEKYRVTKGLMASISLFGNNGLFYLPISSMFAQCIASDGEGFEHVSVTLCLRQQNRPIPIKRTPTWEEMCLIKDMFWDEEDTVIQYHPAKSEYVNNNEYCLHLWRPIGVELPKPHHSLVGIKV